MVQFNKIKQSETAKKCINRVIMGPSFGAEKLTISVSQTKHQVNTSSSY